MNLRERLEILGLASGRILEPIEALGYTPEEIEHKEESFPEEILKAPTLLTYSLLFMDLIYLYQHVHKFRNIGERAEKIKRGGI